MPCCSALAPPKPPPPSAADTLLSMFWGMAAFAAGKPPEDMPVLKPSPAPPGTKAPPVPEVKLASFSMSSMGGPPASGEA